MFNNIHNIHKRTCKYRLFIADSAYINMGLKNVKKPCVIIQVHKVYEAYLTSQTIEHFIYLGSLC